MNGSQLSTASLPELTELVFQFIKKSHQLVKTRENAKAFLTFKDCVLVVNAYKYLKNNEDSSVIEECRDTLKCVQILEQAVNICHLKGYFEIEDAVVVNNVLAEFLQKSQQLIKNKTEVQEEVKSKKKVRQLQQAKLRELDSSESETDSDSLIV